MGRRSQAKQKNVVLNLVAEREARLQGPQTKKKFSFHDLSHITPLNDTQKEVFINWIDRELNMALLGYPGTGKTFLAMYLALSTLLLNPEQYDKIKVVRSIVPVRDIGFLPGTEEEKTLIYETPYDDICDELFKFRNGWKSLKEAGKAEFTPTSFIRGSTWKNTIVIVDEVQNLTLNELHGVMTRIGENSRIILCGDRMQSDLKKGEISSYDAIDSVSKVMGSLVATHFKDIDMVVRSEFVKDYLKARIQCNL